MPPQITAFFQRFGASLRELHRRPAHHRAHRRRRAGGGHRGPVGLAVPSPSYTPLFSGLQATDANGIVEQLRTDNVPYELSDGGATILVPQDKVYDERLKAAAAGLPTAAATGYSLLDKMGVTSSEFQQSVTYKRALEGELASTISAHGRREDRLRPARHPGEDGLRVQEPRTPPPRCSSRPTPAPPCPATRSRPSST